MNLSLTVKPEATDAPRKALLPPIPARIQERGSLLIYLLLLLTPLTFLPPGILLKNSMDSPRRLLMLLGAGLLAALIIRSWSLRGRLVLRWHPLDLPVILYFLGAVVSSIGGVFPRISFCGPVWSEDGLALLWMAVVFYFSIKEFLRTSRQLETAVFLVVLTGGISAVLGFMDWLHLLSPICFNPSFTAPTLKLAEERLVATMGNSMFTGTFFAVLIPLGYGAAVATSDKTRRAMLLVCIALMLLALPFTMARAAWYGLALMVLVLAALILLTMQREVMASIPRPLLITTAVLIFAVIGIGISIPQVRTRLQSMFSMEGTTVQTRKIYMTTAWNMFMGRPIQGVGVGNFQLVFQQYRPSSLAMEQNLPLNRGYNAARPHNLLLEIAGESGLLGLIPFLFLLFTLFRSGISVLRGAVWEAWLGAGMLGLFICYLITNMMAFDNFATMMLFWLTLGLFAALRAQDRALPERYGPLGAPLTGGLMFCLNVASLVIAFGISALFIFQTLAAYSVQQGVIIISQIQENKEPYPLQANEQAIRDIQAGNALSFTNPDYTIYEALFLAYKTQMGVWIDRLEQLSANGLAGQKEAYSNAMTAHTNMLTAGHQALQLMDRDPICARFMVFDYTKLNSSSGFAGRATAG